MHFLKIVYKLFIIISLISFPFSRCFAIDDSSYIWSYFNSDSILVNSENNSKNAIKESENNSLNLESESAILIEQKLAKSYTAITFMSNCVLLLLQK